MKTSEEQLHDEKRWSRISASVAQRFVRDVLHAAGADEPSAEAVSVSLTGASLRGVDSHGVRLLPQYLDVLRSGRINGHPQMKFTRRTPATGVLDADDGYGIYAGYRAVDEAISIAEESGIAAVSVTNSSHFGAAGSFSLKAAEAGYICMVIGNSHKLVLPHGGIRPFHGTNPISFAAPIKGEKPYLLDMATSSIPFNRVLHYQSLHKALPTDAAVDGSGTLTLDPNTSAALLPLGGIAYGYKGAALASLCEVLSSMLTGMAFSHTLLLHGDETKCKTHLGHFILVMKPEAFIEREVFDNQMATYIHDLRAEPAQPGCRVMAPGDREWEVQAQREEQGIPIDPCMWQQFEKLSQEFGIFFM